MKETQAKNVCPYHQAVTCAANVGHRPNGRGHDRDHVQGMRRELAQHLHRQVALVTQQLDILICGKDSQNIAGQSHSGA